MTEPFHADVPAANFAGRPAPVLSAAHPPPSQNLADVLERPIEVARSPETAAVGAAALAFVAAGAYGSIAEAVAAMTEPRVVVTPGLRTSATYDDCYARWRILVQHMEQAP